jgi:hypothetical protein
MALRSPVTTISDVDLQHGIFEAAVRELNDG